MNKKDILSRLDDEIEKLVPSTPSEHITCTPIKVVRDVKGRALTPKRPFVKTRAFKVMCACMVCIAVVTGVLVPVLMLNGGGNAHINSPIVPPGELVLENNTTFLSVDINPSLDFVVDKNGKVKKVISRNTDGDIMLSDDAFRYGVIGKRVEDAVDSTIDQAVRLGYIDADNKTNQHVVRMSVASDSSFNASTILTNVKKSAKDHLRSKGILMKVGGKVVESDSLIANSGLDSIEDYNKLLEEEDDYYYLSELDDKSVEELLSAYKSEFVGEYIEDAIEEIFEDIDDVMSIAEELDAAFADLDEVIRDEEGIIGSINKDYWDYVDKVESIENEDIKKIVLEISGIIEEYNELLIRDSENDDDYVDLSNIFKPIPEGRVLGSVQVKLLSSMSKRYLANIDTIEALIENVLGRVEDSVDNIDSIIVEIDSALTTIFGEASKVALDIKELIDAKIEETIKDANSYIKACEAKLNASLNKHIELGKGNVSNITSDEYDDLLEDIFGDDFDEDDFD